MSNVNRRHFLKSLAATTAGALAGPASSLQAAGTRSAARPKEDGIIDTNVYLGRWPFRQLGESGPENLVEYLRTHGVSQAWTGSLEGLFHKDLRRVNENLAAACRDFGDGLLVPFGAVNPQLPDWREDMRLCDERYDMPGIRIHPNYQNYTLEDDVFVELLEEAAARQMIVQLVPWMEDERHHHTEMPVATTDLSPLPDILQSMPEARLVLLNGFRAAGRLPEKSMETKNLYYDFSKLDVLLGLRRLLDQGTRDRVLFGSYSPMFYFEQAPLKMEESAVTEAEALAIHSQNAQQLLEYRQ